MADDLDNVDADLNMNEADEQGMQARRVSARPRW